MTYKNKFVVAVKANGSVLREQDGTVSLPFGFEYSIFLRNLESVRAQVKVEIDGVDASDGWLILNPNSSLDFERFIRNGNLKSGNKFKFIERTVEIENHRGIKVEDGLVRVEYKFEKVQEVVNHNIHHYNHHYHNDYWYPWYRPHYWNSGPWGGVTSNSGTFNSGIGQNSFHSTLTKSSVPTRSLGAMNCSLQAQESSATLDCDFNDVGITVPGSESNQSFVTTSGFETGNSSTIVLHLRGVVGKKPVTKAVTVRAKPTCSSCGKMNKATHKFCDRCGTALNLI